MAEKDKPLIKIAEFSPGLSTAIAQSNLPKNEISQIAGMVELDRIHKDLISLPQNEAYKKYMDMPLNTRQALAGIYNPKYKQQDLGVVSNVLRDSKSSVYYGGGTTKQEIYGQGIGAGVNLITGAFGSAASELKDAVLGSKFVDATKGPLQKGFEGLIRFGEKLVKQPYQATRLAGVEDKTAPGETAFDFVRYQIEGFKELLPGGEDAVPQDNSESFKRYWEQASTKTDVFDEVAISRFREDLTPAAQYLGRFLASKKDLIENFDDYQDNPGVMDLVNRYVEGDEAASIEVANAIARYEKSKISPGRDIGRLLVQLLPDEAEKAIMGDGKWKAIFNSISGPIDLTVTFGSDPLIVAGKLKRSVDAANYGLKRLGAGDLPLAQAFDMPKVRAYWDEAGKLIRDYRNGDLLVKGAALNRLQDRFREINIGVIESLAKADVKNADDALEYFDNGQRFIEMMSGGLGIRGKWEMMPRMTLARTASNEVRNLVATTLGTERYLAMQPSKTVTEFTNKLDADPITWTENIGFKKTGLVFTAKDKSLAARIDRVIRAFAIAPALQRTINISDGTVSATQIYRLARTVLDKSNAGLWRAAWLAGDEGQRRLMYKGLLKTLGVGMGLNLSAEGRLILSRIDDMSKELYSPSQNVLEVGDDLAKALKTLNSGGKIGEPKGVRKKVQDAIAKTSAENKANRLIASVSEKIKEYTIRLKALRIDLKDARNSGDTVREAAIRQEIKIVGAKLGPQLNIKKELKLAFKKNEEGLFEDIDDMLTKSFNAGQTVDGTPAAIRQYQLNDTQFLPNFIEWREAAQRAGLLTNMFGKATNYHVNRRLTDGWSFLNLYPRLGIRSSVEEVGMFGVISGLEGFGYYLRGRLGSRMLRLATMPSKKITIGKKEKDDSTLGLIYDYLYKITNKHYTKEQKLAMQDNPVKKGEAVANSMLRSKWKPGFLSTKAGQNYSKWTGDFAEFDGSKVMHELNGTVISAERPVMEAELLSNSFKEFGPSVRLNIQNQEAFKGLGFTKGFSEFSSRDDYGLLRWLIELNNTVGKPNGKFGNIVLWNIGKDEKVVISKLVEYIKGPGNDIAKRFAIYSEGAESLATKMYADITYPLRDFSGKINMDLVNAIRNKKSMDNFTIDDLALIDKKWSRPEILMGTEIMPIVGRGPVDLTYHVINSGYSWMGKQIALLDREPITLANYYTFRNILQGYESKIKQKLMESPLTAEGADKMARFSAHESALNMARNRTLAFVDNGDVRTNLAYSLRTLGRYYRATEDFYRRVGRLAKYEKRALVRLAIANQSFEDSGFVHEDDKGQKYYTYPLDDVFAWPVVQALDLIGVTTYTPMPVRLGGYLKMMTPSLDADSWGPGVSGPLASVSLDVLSVLPFIGKYLNQEFSIGSARTDLESILRGDTFGNRSSTDNWLQKTLPANFKRVTNLFFATPENNESRFSSVIKAAKLLVSTENGPTNSSDILPFYQNIATQAKNIDYVKFFLGQATPASIQAFGNKDVPEGLVDSGVYTFTSEFNKILKKFDGDPQGVSKALVMFARLYPSKLAYTEFQTESTTFANFRKTIEAEKFVRDNEKLLIDHADAGSFFIPTGGTEDIGAYIELKKKGYISNKKLDPRVENGKNNFIRQVATKDATIAYYDLKEKYDKLIAEAPRGSVLKRAYRNKWENVKNAMTTAYPLLAEQLNPTTSNPRREEVIEDMRRLIGENRAPNKELANTFAAMISEYDKMISTKNILTVSGSSLRVDALKKQLKEDTKDIMTELIKNNENAQTFYRSVIEPLIGD
jgi:hypothetical protein